MEGGRGEANGEHFHVGYQCGHWGLFHTVGITEGARQIRQNSPAEEGEGGRLQYFPIGSRPSSGRFASVFLEFWSRVGWSLYRLRGFVE